MKNVHYIPVQMIVIVKHLLKQKRHILSYNKIKIFWHTVETIGTWKGLVYPGPILWTYSRFILHDMISPPMLVCSSHLWSYSSLSFWQAFLLQINQIYLFTMPVAKVVQLKERRKWWKYLVSFRLKIWQRNLSIHL